MAQQTVKAVQGGFQYILEPARRISMEEIQHRAAASAQRGYEVTAVLVRRLARHNLVCVTIKGAAIAQLSARLMEAQQPRQAQYSSVGEGMLLGTVGAIMAAAEARAWSKRLEPIASYVHWVCGYGGDTPPSASRS